MTALQKSPTPAYLWLTRFFPYPAHAGDRIYSAKLIEALAEQQCRVTVFCADGGVGGQLPSGGGDQAEWVWCRRGHRQRRWIYPFSRLPRQALQLSAFEPRQALCHLLKRQTWDAVIIDYVSMGWTLPLLAEAARTTGRHPTLLYLAHNHEASLRRLAVSQSTASWPLRLAQHIDGKRVAALESRVLAEVDVVTVNTAADLALFQQDAPKQRYHILVPGYDGPQLEQRQLTPETPRRVVIVGSFDWIVKQQNMVEFLEAAALPLAHHGIGIDIVGSGPSEVLEAWRQRFPNVAIHGRVAAVEPYIQRARLSIVPERTGGGFKHKVLNAVFQRSPIFGIAGSITEVPLIEDHSLRLFPDFPRLVEGVIRAIDDFDTLNTMQNAAYEACRHGFEWHGRGRALHEILSGQKGDW